jgi:hypothetical protein
VTINHEAWLPVMDSGNPLPLAPACPAALFAFDPFLVEEPQPAAAAKTARATTAPNPKNFAVLIIDSSIQIGDLGVALSSST